MEDKEEKDEKEGTRPPVDLAILLLLERVHQNSFDHPQENKGSQPAGIGLKGIAHALPALATSVTPRVALTFPKALVKRETSAPFHTEHQSLPRRQPP